MKTVELNVPDITCEHCVATVRSALSGVEGVATAEVSLSTKRATVSAEDAVADGALLEAVRRAGYSPALR